MKTTKLIVVSLAALSSIATVRSDDISSLFTSTTDPSAWKVSANITSTVASSFGSPIDASLFLTGSGNFIDAVQVTNRGDYIANNSNGYNGGVGHYTQFVFRQTFDLTGYDPTTAALSFKWAADDIGDFYGSADRGKWVPQFRLNDGPFEGADTAAYNYTNNIVQISDGFISGLNTMDFYVQGNGQTDGMELKTVSFTAGPATAGVPDSGGSAMLMLIGLAAVAALRRTALCRERT